MRDSEGALDQACDTKKKQQLRLLQNFTKFLKIISKKDLTDWTTHDIVMAR